MLPLWSFIHRQGGHKGRLYPWPLKAVPVGSIQYPGLPPHTPYLGLPVVFPPGQRPVSFSLFGFLCKFNCKWKQCLAEAVAALFGVTSIACKGGYFWCHYGD